MGPPAQKSWSSDSFIFFAKAHRIARRTLRSIAMCNNFRRLLCLFLLPGLLVDPGSASACSLLRSRQKYRTSTSECFKQQALMLEPLSHPDRQKPTHSSVVCFKLASALLLFSLSPFALVSAAPRHRKTAIPQVYSSQVINRLKADMIPLFRKLAEPKKFDPREVYKNLAVEIEEPGGPEAAAAASTEPQLHNLVLSWIVNAEGTSPAGIINIRDTLRALIRVTKGQELLWLVDNLLLRTVKDERSSLQSPEEFATSFYENLTQKSRDKKSVATAVANAAGTLNGPFDALQLAFITKVRDLALKDAPEAREKPVPTRFFPAAPPSPPKDPPRDADQGALSKKSVLGLFSKSCAGWTKLLHGKALERLGRLRHLDILWIIGGALIVFGLPIWLVLRRRNDRRITHKIAPNLQRDNLLGIILFLMATGMTLLGPAIGSAQTTSEDSNSPALRIERQNAVPFLGDERASTRRDALEHLKPKIDLPGYWNREVEEGLIQYIRFEEDSRWRSQAIEVFRKKAQSGEPLLTALLNAVANAQEAMDKNDERAAAQLDIQISRLSEALDQSGYSEQKRVWESTKEHYVAARMAYHDRLTRNYYLRFFEGILGGMLGIWCLRYLWIQRQMRKKQVHGQILEARRLLREHQQESAKLPLSQASSENPYAEVQRKLFLEMLSAPPVEGPGVRTAQLQSLVELAEYEIYRAEKAVFRPVKIAANSLKEQILGAAFGGLALSKALNLARILEVDDETMIYAFAEYYLDCLDKAGGSSSLVSLIVDADERLHYKYRQAPSFLKVPPALGFTPWDELTSANVSRRLLWELKKQANYRHAGLMNDRWNRSRRVSYGGRIGAVEQWGVEVRNPQGVWSQAPFLHRVGPLFFMEQMFFNGISPTFQRELGGNAIIVSKLTESTLEQEIALLHASREEPPKPKRPHQGPQGLTSFSIAILIALVSAYAGALGAPLFRNKLPFAFRLPAHVFSVFGQQQSLRSA